MSLPCHYRQEHTVDVVVVSTSLLGPVPRPGWPFGHCRHHAAAVACVVTHPSSIGRGAQRHSNTATRLCSSQLNPAALARCEAARRPPLPTNGAPSYGYADADEGGLASATVRLDALAIPLGRPAHGSQVSPSASIWGHDAQPHTHVSVVNFSAVVGWMPTVS